MIKSLKITLNEMKVLPPLHRDAISIPHLDVSLIIPARDSTHSLEATVIEALHFFHTWQNRSFEIILVPNPDPENPSDQSPAIALDLARRFPEVRVCPHHFPRGKGAAVRTGFLHSKGKWVFFTDSDLPYDLCFFNDAAQHLEAGFDLVTGNRRLPSSFFHIPVEVLPLAYNRHRLGLWFNRLVRIVLPITTTDTQAGIKAMSRRLANEVFLKQTCPGFLFDLEIFLTAQGGGYRSIDLPVTLRLNSEKSTVRILRECMMVANWLTRIAWKTFRKGYERSQAKSGNILSRYQQAPLFTRLFLFARWYLTPYKQMAARLPNHGRILDLACGHGLLALTAALRSPERQILGIDHDPKRVALAKKAGRDLTNLNVETGSITQHPSNLPYSGIAIIDAMHYFDATTQESLLKWAFTELEEGGRLLVREVDPDHGITSVWNQIYEKLATTIGFTQSEKKDLCFRSRDEWETLMKTVGFQVRSERCSSFLFADTLFICERSQ